VENKTNIKRDRSVSSESVMWLAKSIKGGVSVVSMLFSFLKAVDFNGTEKKKS
jgi:hypothetical protein